MSKPKEGVAKPLPVRPKKTRTVSSSAPKKPAKKPQHSMPKKVVQKKKSLHKTNPTDLLGKSITITSSDDLGRKIRIVENISGRSKAPKQTYTHVGTPSLAEFKTQLHLALIAPFKYNIDQSQLASNVARYAGTMFVVLGAFFTVYNMSGAISPGANSESLVAQTTTAECISGTYCPPPDSSQTSGSGGSTTIDPTPTADINVEATSNTLTSTVPINITVPLATQVTLNAKNKDTNTYVTIGTAMRTSDLTWRVYWPTMQYDDGLYRIRAVITNEFGTYTVDDSTDYAILNHPVDTTQQSSTSDTTSTTTGTSSSSGSGSTGTTTQTTTVTGTESTTTITNTTATTTTTQLPPLSVELGMSEPLKGVVSVRTIVTGANTVRLFIRKANTTISTSLGYATLQSNGEWRFSWDTTKQANGDYDLKIQALFPNGTSNTKTFEALSILNQTDATTATTTATPQATTTTTTAPIVPDIKLMLAKSNPLMETVDAYVTVVGASFVELYVLPDGSLTSKFLGLAQKQSDSSWRYRIDTRQLPNGSYNLFARVKHLYGTSDSSRMLIKIENKIEPVSIENEEYIETLTATGAEAGETTTPPPTSTTQTSTESLSSPLPTAYSVITDAADEDERDEVEEIMTRFRKDLDALIAEYSKALRSGDENAVRNVQNKLEELRTKVISELPFGDEQKQVVVTINEQLGVIIKDLRERVERSEAIIKERVGDAVTKDSDSDGISDYDEVNLYDTDPFSADSDLDGYTDGIEVLRGFDPKNSAREANLEYESPRETGVVREDLLVIDHITTISDPETDIAPKAQIAGRGLPNSFVTLYIFSTPIVITVKTDSEGNWSYIFDKELEDGEHEVYVGMTDNAGRIVAKSNPLPFVKTAEAFTPVDAEAASAVTIAPESPSLMSDRMLLVVGSLAVVSLGLVLILLGLHVRPKEPELVSV